MKDNENTAENLSKSAAQGALLNDCVRTKMNAVLSKNEIKKLGAAEKNAETGRMEIM